MRGHILEVELNTLDPKSFDKSTQEKHLILTILTKLGPEYAI
jgi:hypothetical protein